MKRFICTVCGYVHEGENPPGECPVCRQPSSKFREESVSIEQKKQRENKSVQTAEREKQEDVSEANLDYDPQFYRVDESNRYMEEIHQMAVSGRSVSSSMATRMKMPNWDDILILGAQLNPPPLDEDAPVTTMTIIGKHAKRPMILENPVYISHMSFGAMSREIKVALAKGSALARTAMCSGEGGILPEEKKAAYKYIFEYVLKEMVDMLRNRSDGRPIGIKISAGRIERDLEYCVYAEPDFITIDGRGGATGSSPFFLREATSVPTIYALHRARKYLDSVHSDISLVITGGLRVSADFAKALAMGADAVAIASAALIAAACQQYRICGSGNCPVGIATQDPKLRERMKVEASAQRVANFLNVSLAELKTFARITGHASVHDLSVEDLVTVSREISEYTEIRHA